MGWDHPAALHFHRWGIEPPLGRPPLLQPVRLLLHNSSLNMKPVYTHFGGTTVLGVLQFLVLSTIMLVLLRGGGGGQYTDRVVSSAGCSVGRESDANLAVLREQLASLLKLRVEYGQLSCQVNGIGPTGGFCLSKDAVHVGGNHQWDAPMCQKMADMFAGKTVLDLGAGLGHYGKCLGEADPSITWFGVDGSEGIENATGMVTHLFGWFLLLRLLRTGRRLMCIKRRQHGVAPGSTMQG
jgi:hypothetical protein